MPEDIIDRYRKLKEWEIPEDTYTYIFSKDHFPMIEKIINELKIEPKLVGTFFGHTLKHAEGQYIPADELYQRKWFKLFDFLKKEKLEFGLAKKMLPMALEHPKMDFTSILSELNFKKVTSAEILEEIQILNEKFEPKNDKTDNTDRINWIMGQLRKLALGNMDLKELSEKV